MSESEDLRIWSGHGSHLGLLTISADELVCTPWGILKGKHKQFRLKRSDIFAATLQSVCWGSSIAVKYRSDSVHYAQTTFFEPGPASFVMLTSIFLLFPWAVFFPNHEEARQVVSALSPDPSSRNAEANAN